MKEKDENKPWIRGFAGSRIAVNTLYNIDDWVIDSSLTVEQARLLPKWMLQPLHGYYSQAHVDSGGKERVFTSALDANASYIVTYTSKTLGAPGYDWPDKRFVAMVVLGPVVSPISPIVVSLDSETVLFSGGDNFIIDNFIIEDNFVIGH